MNIVVGILAILIGIGLIAVGRNNVATQTSSETGSRRITNRLAGQSSDYTGSKAVLQGRIRIVTGAALIVFGIVFAIIG